MILGNPSAVLLRAARSSIIRAVQLDGVPSSVESRALGNGMETQHWVLVFKSLAHRARWATAQLPPPGEEVSFLATGKLSEQK
jgi:hypothetical protein